MSEKMLQQILHEIKDVKQDQQEMKEEFSGFKHDLSNIKHEQQKMKEVFSGFKQEQGSMKEEFVGFKQEQEAMKDEFSGFKQEQNAMKEEFTGFKHVQLEMRTEMDRRFDVLKTDVKDIKQSVARIEKNVPKDILAILHIINSKLDQRDSDDKEYTKHRSKWNPH